MTSREFLQGILAPVFEDRNPSLDEAVSAILAKLEEEWGIAEYDESGGLERIRYRDYDHVPVSRKLNGVSGENVGLVFRLFTDWSSPHS